MAVLAGFVFTTTTVDAKPRKRHYVERMKARKTVEPKTASDTETDSDGTRWRYGSSAIIVDANTDKVLYEQNADALRHPASVTKVMTLYLLFEQLDAGKLKLTSELPVSAEAASQSPTKLFLRPGATIEVEDAIKGLVTRSANDAAVVIAEAIGGSEAAFARMMTAKAHALGMSRTTFRNASGLPNPGQVTTARDLATLGRAIQDRFPKYYRYFATRTFHYRGQAIGNHNRLLGEIEGVDGIKTGYTRASGFNLLTSVHRDDRFLIGVVLGGRSGRSRDARMANLISDYLPKAYAGRRTAPKVMEAATPSSAPAPASAPIPEARPEVIARAAPIPPRVDRAAAEADQKTKMVVALLAKPIVADPAPAKVGDAKSAAAKAGATKGGAARETIVTASIPVDAPADVQAAAAATPAGKASTKVAANAPAKSGAKAGAKPAPDAQDAAGTQVAGTQVADASDGADASTVQVGSIAPITPSGVKTVAIQRPVVQAALASSLAPPTQALGYAGPTESARLAPPATASAAIAQKVATARPTRSEISAEDRARYEASVWPVFDDQSSSGNGARNAEDDAPVRTASITPTPAPSKSQKPASAHSGWGIQVGAFDEETDARASLDLARSKAKSVLDGADPYTEPVMKGSTQLYRARFAGLDEKGAKRACRLLQRNDFACMTIRN